MKKKKTESELLTLRETAAALRCSRATVFRLVADQQLTVVRIRGLVRVRREAIAALLDCDVMEGQQQ